MVKAKVKAVSRGEEDVLKRLDELIGDETVDAGVFTRLDELVGDKALGREVFARLDELTSNAADKTRKRVEEVTGDGEATPDPEDGQAVDKPETKRSGFDAFIRRIDEDPKLEKHLERLSIVLGLLRGFYKKQDDVAISLIEAARIDEKNLQEFLQALASNLREDEELMKDKKIVDRLSEKGKIELSTVVYNELLGLADDADVPTVVKKCNDFISSVKDLDYIPDEKKRNALLDAINEVRDGKAVAVAQKHGLYVDDEPNVLEKLIAQSIIDKLLEGARKKQADKATLAAQTPATPPQPPADPPQGGTSPSNPPTPPAAPKKRVVRRAAADPVKPEIDFADFYQNLLKETENYIGESFSHLRAALGAPDEAAYDRGFKDKYFNGDSGRTMTVSINGKLGKGFCQALFSVAQKLGSTDIDLIEAIAKFYGLEHDQDGLQTKLLEVNNALVDLYKDLGNFVVKDSLESTDEADENEESDDAPESEPDTGSTALEKLTLRLVNAKNAVTGFFRTRFGEILKKDDD